MTRIRRIPNRIREDLKIIRLLVNWREVLAAKLRNGDMAELYFRNGVILKSPPEVNLNFLFHEIWISEFYAPDGYAIRDGETVVDIGANIGVFATWAATRARDVKVLSFEPFPANATQFIENQSASRLENISFRQAAVGRDNGSRTLNVSDSWILHSLAPSESDKKGIQVDCVSLDSVLGPMDRCDFLKMDCEGGEYEILFSASADTIGKIGRIVCEFNILDDEQRNGTGLKAFLETNGFVIDDLRVLDPTSGFICARNTKGA